MKSELIKEIVTLGEKIGKNELSKTEAEELFDKVNKLMETAKKENDLLMYVLLLEIKSDVTDYYVGLINNTYCKLEE